MCGEAESFRWFLEGFVGQTEGAVVHRDHQSRVQLDEGFQSFLGVHVDRTQAWWVVCTDWQERDVDWESRSDFAEPVKVRRVAAVVNHAARDLDDKAPETAVRIVKHSGTPMMARRQRDAHGAVFKALPVVQFLHNAKTEIMHEVADLEWNNDRLVRRDSAQGPAVKVVEVRVGDQDEVDPGKRVEFDAWIAHPFNTLHPVAPDWVDEDVETGGLEQERRVANPGECKIVAMQLGPLWPQGAALALCEK